MLNDLCDVLYSPRYKNGNSLVADSSGRIYGWSKHFFGYKGDTIEDKSTIQKNSGGRIPTREDLDKELDNYLTSNRRSNGSDPVAEARPFSSRNDNAANNFSETGSCSKSMKENIRTGTHQCSEYWCPFRNKKTLADDPPEIGSRSYRQDPKWRRGPTFRNEKTADDSSGREWAKSSRSSFQDTNKKTADNFPGIDSRSHRQDGDRQRSKERRSFQTKKTTEDRPENGSRSNRRDEDGGWSSGWGSRSNRSNGNGGLSKGRRFSSNGETADKLSKNGSRSNRSNENYGKGKDWRVSSTDETADQLSQNGSRSNRSNNENFGKRRNWRVSSNDETTVKRSEDDDYFRRPHDEDSVWVDEDLLRVSQNNKTITDDLPEIVPNFKKGRSFCSRRDEDNICTEWDKDEPVPQNDNNTITDDLPKIAPRLKKGNSFRSRGRHGICLDKDGQIPQNDDNETIAERPKFALHFNTSQNIGDESRDYEFSKDYETADDEDERSSQNNETTTVNYRSDISTSELLTLQEKDYERKYNRCELADYGEHEDYYRGFCRRTPDSLSDLVLCPPWKLKPDDTRSIIDFIDQFWDRIGQFISDPILRLIRFKNILAASPETRFLTYDVNEYIVCCSLFKEEGGPEFRFVEKMLRSIFWPPELQMKIARDFAASRYDPDGEQKTKYAFVTFWYCKLMQIKPCGPEDPLRALTNKMPEEFTRWIKMKYGKSYPDSICELCVWIRRFDVPTV